MIKRFVAALALLVVLAAPQASSALAYTSSWEGCVDCNEQWKSDRNAFDPKTDTVKGAVDNNDPNVYIVTVKNKKTGQYHEYWLRGTCENKPNFRLTLHKDSGIIDVHVGSRGKNVKT